MVASLFEWNIIERDTNQQTISQLSVPQYYDFIGSINDAEGTLYFDYEFRNEEAEQNIAQYWCYIPPFRQIFWFNNLTFERRQRDRHESPKLTLSLACMILSISKHLLIRFNRNICLSDPRTKLLSLAVWTRDDWVSSKSVTYNAS